MGSALVRVGVRQHAPPESISKHALQPLGHLSTLESTSCERPDIRLAHLGCDCPVFLDRITIQQFTSEPTHVVARIVSDP
jgi:hypothetical protein